MPRAGLNTSRVVDAACVLADEVGLGNLTLAALADRLGVRQPSLYKHIDGMAALQRAIAIRAKSDLGDVLARAAVGRSQGDAVRALAAAYRAWALRHPGRYAATVRAPRSDDHEDAAASARVVETVVSVLSGFGLQGDEAIHATRALRSGLHGFVSIESSDGFGMPVDTGASFDFLVEGYVQAMSARGSRSPFLTDSRK